MAVFEEAGRGRKLCSGCQKYIGIRTRKCPNCGKVDDNMAVPSPRAVVREIGKVDDNMVVPSPRAVVQQGREIGERRLLSVSTPAPHVMPCPKLNGDSYEEVSQWAAKVMETGYKEDRLFTLPALQYYVREFFEYGSNQYRQVCEHLVRCYAEREQTETDDPTEGVNHPNNSACSDHLQFMDEEGFCISCGEK